MNHFSKISGLLLLLIVQACPTPQTVISPSASPSAVMPSESPASEQKSGILTVFVKDGITNLPVGNSTVQITSSTGTNLTQKTDSSGKIVFDNLNEGQNFNIIVSATNYLLTSSSTASSNLEIKNQSPQTLTVTLFKVSGTFKGKVISSDGTPVDSAMVKIGNSYGLTSENGTFNIPVTSLSNPTFNIYKTGFNTSVYNSNDFLKENNYDAGEIKISKSLNNPVIFFETDKKPFGDNINHFDKLQELATSNGYKVLSGNLSERSTLNDLDIIVIGSPSLDYSSSEIEKISAFVKSGKKLVILGEWGGFGGFKADSVNKILKNANLEINPDIVKETVTENIQNTDEQIIPATLTPHFITKGISKLVFYGSASVNPIQGGIKTLDTNFTKQLVFSSSNGFRIQIYNKGQFGMLGVSNIEAGKVVVLGDSSIFTSSDSDNDGIINLNEFDNKFLALNIFKW